MGGFVVLLAATRVLRARRRSAEPRGGGGGGDAQHGGGASGDRAVADEEDVDFEDAERLSAASLASESVFVPPRRSRSTSRAGRGDSINSTRSQGNHKAPVPGGYSYSQLER